MNEPHDLITVADKLGRSGPYRRFAGLVDRARGYMSMGLDLQSAEQQLDILRKIIRHRREYNNTPDEPVIADGLFASALILYAKVHDSHKGRFPFSAATTNEHEKNCHKRLMDLRNNGVGHYVIENTSETTPWANDRLIYWKSRSKRKFEYPYRRHTYRAADLDALEEMVPKALAKSDLKLRETELLLEQEMQRLGLDPVFVKALAESEFDVEAFFGSGQNAAAAAKGIVVRQSRKASSSNP